jgi:hypothetical protein
MLILDLSIPQAFSGALEGWRRPEKTIPLQN